MGVSAYMSLTGGRRWWVLINFFYLKDGRLFEVGANSRLVAYLNKYSKSKTNRCESKPRKYGHKINPLLTSFFGQDNWILASFCFSLADFVSVNKMLDLLQVNLS